MFNLEVVQLSSVVGLQNSLAFITEMDLKCLKIPRSWNQSHNNEDQFKKKVLAFI